MMGRLNHEQEQFFYSFRLDDVVPGDHPVRRISLFESYAHSFAETRIGGLLHLKNSAAAAELFAALPRRLGSLAEKDVSIAASILEHIRNADLPKPSHGDDEETAA